MQKKKKRKINYEKSNKKKYYIKIIKQNMIRKTLKHLI